jgi:hypothetical protein
MADLQARHYLRIYRIKLALAVAGTTTPSKNGLKFIRTLVSELSKLNPDDPVHLEANDLLARFTDVATGRLLAEILHVDDVQHAFERTRRE